MLSSSTMSRKSCATHCSSLLSHWNAGSLSCLRLSGRRDCSSPSGLRAATATAAPGFCCSGGGSAATSRAAATRGETGVGASDESCGRSALAALKVRRTIARLMPTQRIRGGADEKSRHCRGDKERRGHPHHRVAGKVPGGANVALRVRGLPQVCKLTVGLSARQVPGGREQPHTEQSPAVRTAGPI